MSGGPASNLEAGPPAASDTWHGRGLPGGRSLVLVGLMGSGKSTVGRRLATRLDMPFVDADDEIEKAAGCSISDIFDSMGEAAFRDGERRVIARLLSAGPVVLATGGGAFMAPDTRERIRAGAISIWLRAGLDILVRRCQRRSHRPLLQKGNMREILRDLMAQRDPVYAEADITVDSGEDDHEAVVDRIVAALGIHAIGPDRRPSGDGQTG